MLNDIMISIMLYKKNKLLSHWLDRGKNICNYKVMFIVLPVCLLLNLIITSNIQASLEIEPSARESVDSLALEQPQDVGRDESDVMVEELAHMTPETILEDVEKILPPVSTEEGKPVEKWEEELKLQEGGFDDLDREDVQKMSDLEVLGKFEEAEHRETQSEALSTVIDTDPDVLSSPLALETLEEAEAEMMPLPIVVEDNNSDIDSSATDDDLVVPDEADDLAVESLTSSLTLKSEPELASEVSEAAFEPSSPSESEASDALEQIVPQLAQQVSEEELRLKLLRMKVEAERVESEAKIAKMKQELIEKETALLLLNQQSAIEAKAQEQIERLSVQKKLADQQKEKIELIIAEKRAKEAALMSEEVSALRLKSEEMHKLNRGRAIRLEKTIRGTQEANDLRARMRSVMKKHLGEGKPVVVPAGWRTDIPLASPSFLQVDRTLSSSESWWQLSIFNSTARWKICVGLSISGRPWYCMEMMEEKREEVVSGRSGREDGDNVTVKNGELLLAGFYADNRYMFETISQSSVALFYDRLLVVFYPCNALSLYLQEVRSGAQGSRLQHCFGLYSNIRGYDVSEWLKLGILFFHSSKLDMFLCATIAKRNPLSCLSSHVITPRWVWKTNENEYTNKFDNSKSENGNAISFGLMFVMPLSARVSLAMTISLDPVSVYRHNVYAYKIEAYGRGRQKTNLICLRRVDIADSLGVSIFRSLKAGVILQLEVFFQFVGRNK